MTADVTAMKMPQAALCLRVMLYRTGELFGKAGVHPVSWRYSTGSTTDGNDPNALARLARISQTMRCIEAANQRNLL